MENTAEYDPKETLLTMTYKNFLWGLIGIVLGVLINLIIDTGLLRGTGKYTNEIKLLLQLTICSFVLAYVHVKSNNKFGWSWQNITPGLFFVSFFFGTQFATFSNIQTINNNIMSQFSA